MSEEQTLSQRLLKPATRPDLVRDCVTELEEEVAAQRGLKGLAVKGGYKTVKAIKPGFISGVLDVLLDEWTVALEDEYQSWKTGDGQGSFGSQLLGKKDLVAERMLGVTDRRAERSAHTTAKKLYFKLRPAAKNQVVNALPRVTRVLDRYMDA
ncbi:MAG: hypothetical protein VX938_01605 [Myxococcota bacterium]|nr:hypothetical protein [Myxococcota bacterium]MEE2780233.1 hypothetical protein [Myxococcota bacterium]